LSFKLPMLQKNVALTMYITTFKGSFHKIQPSNIYWSLRNSWGKKYGKVLTLLVPTCFWHFHYFQKITYFSKDLWTYLEISNKEIDSISQFSNVFEIVTEIIEKSEMQKFQPFGTKRIEYSSTSSFFLTIKNIIFCPTCVLRILALLLNMSFDIRCKNAFEILSKSFIGRFLNA